MDPYTGYITIGGTAPNAVRDQLIPVPKQHHHAAIVAADTATSLFDSGDRAARRWANAHRSRSRMEASQRKSNRRRNKRARIARRVNR